MNQLRATTMAYTLMLRGCFLLYLHVFVINCLPYEHENMLVKKVQVQEFGLSLNFESLSNCWCNTFLYGIGICYLLGNLQRWCQSFECRGGATARNFAITNGSPRLSITWTQSIHVVWSKDIISSFCTYCFFPWHSLFIQLLYENLYKDNKK